MILLLSLTHLLACRGPAEGDIRGPGTPDPDSAAGPELVDVAHDREMRAAWVATVSNIDFPSSKGLSADAQKAELVAILDRMAEARLNVMVFQVRPEGDALYASKLEPWSRYLTGTQGQPPGYDPLAYAIEQAHARNIEVHAWLNPYRAKASASSAAVSPHMSVEWPQYAYSYSGYLWMDPGAAVVQDRLVDVVTDIVTRYDVDGIHFDDYFYPYPDDTDFPDAETYAAYTAAGGTLSHDDWRRDNVNQMVRRVSEAVAAVDPDVRFGISPFGIYRPGVPEGITGLDQYAAIFADPVEWTEQGWLDYLAPQLYWTTGDSGQEYGKLIEWWAELPDNGQYTFAGNYLSKLGTTSEWTIDELRAQIALSRQHREAGSLGNIFFSVAPLMDDAEGVVSVLGDDLYAVPALVPPMRTRKDVIVAPPHVDLQGRTAQLSHDDAIRAFVLYSEQGDGWIVDRIVPADTSTVELAAGRWAISAAGRHDVESRGVLVTVQ